MSSVQNGWLLDYGLVEEIQGSEFIWAPAPQIVDDPTSRTRPESCAAPGSKACREKLRRDKLNERFVELSSIVDPGKPPKADKVAILSDAARLLNQLRAEAQKLKKSNETLQDAIKALKAEKSELRDEKVRLKSEKERIEQMLKGVSFSPQFIAHPAAAFYAAPFAASNKSTPYTNYPPRSFLQWIPPAALDTSKDPVCWPPVA
ncbi:transcription factor bHLH115-like isoform X2 [Typha latifolia]|uniref:transcription factor bHLH115-like isoform X2 n=1 Tax=Typha latifolia TaxID=4733 RepID=UPI003C308597